MEFFYRSLVLNDLISYNDFKTFRTELSNRTMSLLKHSESLTCCQIRNYFLNNESCCGVTVDDYIDSIICENGEWVSKFEMICVSIIYYVRVISITNMKGGFMISDSLESSKLIKYLMNLLILLIELLACTVIYTRLLLSQYHMINFLTTLHIFSMFLFYHLIPYVKFIIMILFLR